MRKEKLPLETKSKLELLLKEEACHLLKVGYLDTPICCVPQSAIEGIQKSGNARTLQLIEQARNCQYLNKSMVDFYYFRNNKAIYCYECKKVKWTRNYELGQLDIEIFE